MATKTEIKQLLTELGLTEQDMDRFWQENVDFGYNKTILALNRSGLNWRGLSPRVIKELPNQLEKDKHHKEMSEKVALIKEIKPVKKTAKEKLLSGETLSEREIRDLINEYEIEEIAGDSGRWTRYMTTIIQVDGVFYSIDWQQGLTEMQCDAYLDQPVKVRKHTYQKMITVVEWLPE